MFFGETAETLAAEGDELTDRVASTLREWINHARQRGVAAVFEAAQVRGMGRRVLAQRGGERHMTDLAHIAQLLHEIAHVTVPVVKGTGRKHIIHGAEYKATLLRYERIWRRHNKLRARQIVTAAEPDETTQPQLKAKKTRRSVTYVPLPLHYPQRSKGLLTRLTEWVALMLRLIPKAASR